MKRKMLATFLLPLSFGPFKRSNQKISVAPPPPKKKKILSNHDLIRVFLFLTKNVNFDSLTGSRRNFPKNDAYLSFYVPGTVSQFSYFYIVLTEPRGFLAISGL